MHINGSGAYTTVNLVRIENISLHTAPTNNNIKSPGRVNRYVYITQLITCQLGPVPRSSLATGGWARSYYTLLSSDDLKFDLATYIIHLQSL